MKQHIVVALYEQFNHWEELLASLSEEQVITPQFDDDWYVKKEGFARINVDFTIACPQSSASSSSSFVFREFPTHRKISFFTTGATFVPSNS